MRTRDQKSPLRLGTASKAVQALTDEYIVIRDSHGLRVADAQRLMTNLRERYRWSPARALTGTTILKREGVWARLSDARRECGLRAAATGMASADHYGVLSGMERLSLYVDDLSESATVLEVKEGRTFANIELIETDKNLHFFDIREDNGEIWASPVQTWLELAQGGPREREAATSLGRALIAGRGEAL
jgi:hypothetical protein